MNSLKRVKKVLLMMYSIQGFITLSLMFGVVLSLFDVVSFQIRILFVAMFYMANAVACGISFHCVLGKALLEAYPKFYKEILVGYPLTKIILVFPDNATDDFVRYVKKYFYLSG
ncbi:MAG: hypothetical protein FWD19_02425 [Defluviitaleaceae bacterium]|nr:hypothetical protein [Defluviitaleaceae bacterium]